jgi:hypothetical protein
MAREITEQDLANKGVSGLPDVPGLTTEAMQKKFDEISRELLVPRFNEMAKEVNEVNENLKSIHEKYITTDASGTVIENTELATFLLRNIGSVPANGTKTLDYVNSAGQSGSFVVSKMSDVYFSGLYFTPFMSRPCYFTHNNGTWTWEELAKNSDLGYMNITDQFTLNTDNARINAYVENGVVVVNVSLKAGFNGSVNVADLTNLKYAPRTSVYGYYCNVSTATDKNKYVGSYINDVGDMYVWCDSAISNSGQVTFTYPLRRD